MITCGTHTLKTLKTQSPHLKAITDGFPGGLVVKNAPADAEDAGSIPDPGRSHTPQGNWAHAPRLRSLLPGAQEPWLPKPARLEPRLCTTGQCNGKLVSTATEQPLLSPTRKEPSQQQRPNNAKGRKKAPLRKIQKGLSHNMLIFPETFP